MKKSQVTVNNPCSQSWNSMNPNEQGRFCESCNKTVVDFTKMKNEEILTYLKEQKEKTCGYFLPHQVEVKRPKHHQFLLHWYQVAQTGIKTHFLQKASLALIAFCMFMVGCTPEPLTGEIDCTNRDTSDNYIPMPNDSSPANAGGNIIGDTTVVYERKTVKVEKVMEPNILGDIEWISVPPIDSGRTVSPDSSETKKEG